MAIYFGCVSVAIAYDIATHDYVLVDDWPSREAEPIADAVGISLIGAAVGVALIYSGRRCHGTYIPHIGNTLTRN
jgi:hypothetical protein